MNSEMSLPRGIVHLVARAREVRSGVSVRSAGSSGSPAMNSAHENSVRCRSGVSSPLATGSAPTPAATATGSGSGACEPSSTSSASAATYRACSKTDSTEPASSSPAPRSR